MPELQNTFSWSHSRQQVFAACLRRYYLNHYAFWKGWEDHAPPGVREIYIQKKLTRRPMWLGTVVHGAAEDCLKALMARRPRDKAQAIQRALTQARQDIEGSARGGYRANPTRIAGFQEHYYPDDACPPEAWDETLTEIQRQVSQLHEDPVYRRMTEVPDRLVEVEKLEQINVGDVPVWVKLDALVSDGRGGLVVVDWKTGRHHEDETIATQLGIYGLYCVQRHRAAPDRIQAMHVNLRTGERTKHPIGPAVLEQARAHVTESAAAMRRLLRDADRNKADAEDFPLLPPGAPSCRGCAFRRTCAREGGDPD